MVAHTPELQAYTASRLFTALQADVSQESLTLAAVWIIGEYGETLLESGIVEDDNVKPVSPLLVLIMLIELHLLFAGPGFRYCGPF